MFIECYSALNSVTVFVIMLGIPALVLLDENDEVITAEGRFVISKDPEGKVGSDFVLLVLVVNQCYCGVHFDAASV